MIKNMSFEKNKTKFCIPVPLFNNYKSLYGLHGLIKTQIPSLCYGVIYTKQWLLGYYTISYPYAFSIIIITCAKHLETMIFMKQAEKCKNHG